MNEPQGLEMPETNKLKDIKYPENFMVHTVRESIDAIKYVEEFMKKEHGIKVRLQFRISSQGIITLVNVIGGCVIKSKTSPARFSLQDVILGVEDYYESDIRGKLQCKIIESFTQKTLSELEEIWALAKIELIIQGE